MAYNLIACDRNQIFLVPQSMDEWLPKDHLARFVVASVSVLDMKPFYRKRRSDGWGRAAYDPAMMVALLIYAYATGTRSSRKIERRCVEDIALRYICANETPDHSTIARVVKDHEAELGGLFAQVLALAVELGLVRVGVVALDSTRVQANASPGANRSEEWIAAEVAKILAEAKATDEQEDRASAEAPGGDIPKELTDENERLARLLAAKARLDAEAAERQAAYEAKLAKREEFKEQNGKQMPGRKPKPPESRRRDVMRSKKANTTDPDSRTMSTANEGYLQGYSGQAVVTEDQITVAVAVTNDATDFAQLQPMAEQAAANLEAAGTTTTVGVLLADAGYLSMANLGLEAELGVELLIATKESCDPPRGRIPKGLTPIQRMTRKLATKRGKALYAKRGGAIEATFGQLRQRGVGRFRRRGLAACESEWRFEHAVHNLLKIKASGKMVAGRPQLAEFGYRAASGRLEWRPAPLRRRQHLWPFRCRGAI